MDEKNFETPDNILELEEVGVTAELRKEIQKTVTKLKAENPEVEVVYPLAVKGDPKRGDKALYLAYFREPNFKFFTKYLVGSQQSHPGAMRQLARDCFLDGDKELIDRDSLFLFGLMGQLNKIIEMRNGALVNL